MTTSTSSMAEEIQALAGQIGRPIRIMEVCGTHTMSAFRTGLRSILGEGVSLLSGPGCPVCVTDITYVDKAVALAERPDTIVTTFGDMIRVPGSERSLETAKAQGADVRVVYSPLDAVDLAKREPEKQVVFLGVGFETTTPTIAWTIPHAKETELANYSVLCAHKLIPPAMDALLSSGDVMIDGFMCPGHVSIIIGADAYEFIPEKFGIPCVAAGFEAADMAECIVMILKQIVEKRCEVEIQYKRSVQKAGNQQALDLMNRVFETDDAAWRGLGVIPGSGLKIKDEFGMVNAERLLEGVALPDAKEPKGCSCGSVLKGTIIPPECPLFGKTCTPDNPVGACMVSSEGSCAAYFRYAEISE